MEIEIDFKRSADAVKLAKKVIELHDWKPKPDPACRTCNGTGEYEEESHHNGDFYMASCDCTRRNRPVVHVNEWSAELLEMARFFLKDT